MLPILQQTLLTLQKLEKPQFSTAGLHYKLLAKNSYKCPFYVGKTDMLL